MPSPSLAFALPVVLFVHFWALCYWPLAAVVRAAKTGAKRWSAWLLRSRVGKLAIGHSGPIGSYAPIFLIIVLGGIAAIGAGSLLIELAEQIRLTTSAVDRVDVAIQTWFGQERQPAMTVLFSIATSIGSAIGLGAIVVVVAALLVVRKERASAIFVVVTVGVGELLNLGLKMIFMRTRPDLTSALTTARW